MSTNQSSNNGMSCPFTFDVGLSQQRRAPHKCDEELILQKATSFSIKHFIE